MGAISLEVGCDPESVSAQLERILAGPPLKSSPTLSRFLRYIVKETLAGRSDSIGEYSLGVGVFGRGQMFNRRLDPIVRVQARNLRARLAQYYAGPGADDPIVIDLPRRSYVPLFRSRTPREVAAPPPPPAEQAAHPDPVLRSPARVPVIATAILLLLGGTLPLWQMLPAVQSARAAYEPDPAAQDLYIRGRYLMDRQTEPALRESIDCFERSSARAPRFAVAFTGLADAYNMLAQYGYMPPREAMDRAREAARHALAIDPNLAEAHISLAAVIEAYDWNWPAAEREYRRALALNRGLSAAHLWYGMFLRDQGRLKEALPELRLAAELEPLSVLTSLNLAYALMLEGNPGAALEQAQRAAELAPGLAAADLLLSSLYRAQARTADSDAALERARSLAAGNPHALAMLACAYAKRGQRDESARLLQELQQLATQRYVSPFDLGNVSLNLGDEDRAVALFEEAYRQRSSGLVLLRTERDYFASHSPKLLPLIDRIRTG